jgi:hypothetical protein
MIISAGAPRRLGKVHPSSAVRRSGPPSTELTPLSPRGKGADVSAPRYGMQELACAGSLCGPILRASLADVEIIVA